MTDEECLAYTEAQNRPISRPARSRTSQALDPTASPFIPSPHTGTPEGVAPQDVEHIPGTNAALLQHALTMEQARNRTRGLQLRYAGLEEEPEEKKGDKEDDQG
jgi:hypothetical protein